MCNHGSAGWARVRWPQVGVGEQPALGGGHRREQTSWAQAEGSLLELMQIDVRLTSEAIAGAQTDEQGL